LVKTLLFSLLVATSAQALEVVAQIDPVPARVGQRIELTLRVSSDSRQAVEVEDFGLGSFTLIKRAGVSSSTQMTFSGGRRAVVHSSTLRFTLRAPDTPGEHPLGPVKVRAGTQRGQSASVPVRVLGANQPATSPGQPKGDLFVDFSVSPERPYVGEQFTVTAHVYSRVRLEGVADLDFPEAKGIWWEQLENPNRAGSEVVVHAGRRYRRHMVGRIAGFAESQGELILNGGEAVVQILQGDLFFGGLKEKTVLANPILLDVQALPQGVNATQVGRYNVRHGFVPTRLNLGDVIEIKVTVKGQGNIKAFTLPEFKLQQGLRGFTPKREVSMEEGSNPLAGTLNWTLPIQATIPGKHRIEGATLRWFDPGEGKLRSARVGPFEFDVVGELLVPKETPQQAQGSVLTTPQRGPIGGFRAQRPAMAWLAHPSVGLLLALLLLLLWLPRKTDEMALEEGQALGSLESALETALGVPVRGLGRDELLAAAAAALGEAGRRHLEASLDQLDAAAYGPSEQTAEALKSELVVWLGSRR
jgi:hypothetical protein